MLSIYRLPNQIPDEKIVKVLRRDFFILFKKSLLFVVLSIMPIFFFGIMLYSYPNLLQGDISYPIIIVGASAYYLFVWLFFFFSFIDYYLDIWIITNERIIDIRQEGFFSRTIAEQRLSKVQDVMSTSKGFSPTVLKYGDVNIQTAGAEQRLLLSEVPNPDGVRSIISKLVEEKHKNEMSL